MNRWRTRAIGLVAATGMLSCSGGNETPANDTTPPDSSPAGPVVRPPVTAPAWNADAGMFFAIQLNGGAVRLVNPSFTADQALDSVAVPDDAIGATLDLVGAGRLLGTATVEATTLDSACVGWPAARLTSGAAAAWRVAFPAGRVDPVAFDSLAGLTGPDSIAVTTSTARAASRLPGDTTVVFRGRPFVVRQANRFTSGPSVITLVEVVRQVPQEANPLQEQTVMILVADSAASPSHQEIAAARREIGFEEQLASIELVAVVRIRASGRLAMLLRREHDGGFTLQWYEQGNGNQWTLRWEGALDSC